MNLVADVNFVVNPSPIIFAGALALKVRKIEIKIQFQRNEASQRLVKHNIMISLHSFLKTFSACCFDFNGRREVYLKFTNASLQNTVLHEAYYIRSLSHIHVSTVSFLHSFYCCFSISAYSFHDIWAFMKASGRNNPSTGIKALP